MYCIQDKKNKNDSDLLFSSKEMESNIIALNKINNSLSELQVISIETTTDLYNVMEICDLIFPKTEKKNIKKLV
ncbi:MAG: hypothetical protein ACFFCE_15675 [Promethearchaeota archaeon]